MTAGTEPSTRWPAIPKDVGGSGAAEPGGLRRGLRRTSPGTRPGSQLAGLPGGRGLNIAHEAVDRHAAGAARAATWRCGSSRADGSSHPLTYARARASRPTASPTSCAASASGAASGCSRCSGAVPELYVAALGTLKNGSVFCPLFSAFGPEPIRQRLQLGDGAGARHHRARSTGGRSPQLRDALPELEHVLLVGRRRRRRPGHARPRRR